MHYEAVIFDLDGTLLNTLEDLAGSVNRVLRERGLPVHECEAYRYFVGDGFFKLVKRALPERYREDEEKVREYLEAFQRDYALHWNEKTSPYPGIPEMLDALEARHLRIAILSNKKHEFVLKCVESLLARWNFEAVLGQKSGVPRKPDPWGALKVAERFSVVPSRILYLGDTSVDMETARRAGMVPVGVLWGFRPGKELQEAGAEALLESPLDLLKLLEGRPFEKESQM